jgi:hypothetical protein
MAAFHGKRARPADDASRAFLFGVGLFPESYLSQETRSVSEEGTAKKQNRR